MKHLLIILLLIPLNLLAPDSPQCYLISEHGIRDEALLRAIIQVESQGNPLAINWRENAIGLLQIRDVMLREANRIVGYQKYTRADCLDSLRAIEIFWLVQDFHNPTGDYYKGSRIWNGRSKRDIYWKKVKKLI